MKEIDSFTDRVIQAIETKRQEKGMAVAELIAKSGITRRTWFRKMRGDTEFTTSEIDAIAKALDCDALLLLQEAAHEPTDEETVIKATLQKLQENPMLLAAYMSKEKEKDEAINGAAGPDYDEPA
nr:helix-turn-helix domain-containing protein [Bifidobacterium catenulatum]